MEKALLFYIPEGNCIFGLIVDNRIIVYKRQNFLKAVIHLIIIDRCDQSLDEIQVMVSYSSAILVAVTSE